MNDPIKSLELDIILKHVASFATSFRAQNVIINTVPQNDITEVNELLEYTSQGVIAIDEFRYPGVERFEPIDDIIQSAAVGSILSMRDLLYVAGVLRSARNAKKTLLLYPQKVEKLVDIGGRMYVNEALEDDIRKKIVSENEMSDTASEALRDIRIKIKSVKSKLYDKLGSFTRSNEYSKFLQDNLYTIRNGRYVLPVKNECRQDVKGLLHDQSASGATAFIEPYEVVEMNNEVIKLESDEHREIERILSQLSSDVSAVSEWLVLCQEQLTILDVIIAKARYSLQIKGSRPRTNYAKYITLDGARHPLIDIEKVIAVDISLGQQSNILLISGPNTGGKTASLKTVGLLSYMMCCGLFLPCREGSEMAVFDKIYCDIGDSQDIRQSLSTFSSHIKNLKEITDSFTNESLILLDEIGSCTDPHEGSAIAVGVIDFIAKTKAKAIITTHYPQLKEYALLHDNIQNAGMQFDPDSLKPTFKLLIGYPGSSNAIETASALGLSETILDTARMQLGGNKEKNYEQLIREAGEVMAQALSEREDALKKAKDTEDRLKIISEQEKKVSDALARINQNAKAETRRLVVKAMDNLNDMVDEVKEKLKTENESALFEAKKLMKRINNVSYEMSEDSSSVMYEPLKIEDIRIGGEVFVLGFGQVGTVKSIKQGKNEAEVSVLGKLIKAKISDLASPVKTVQKQSKPAVAVSAGISVASNYEVNIIGKSVSEAEEILEPLLAGAKDMNIAVMRIVHGKGTGILGRGVQQMLRQYKNIKSFRYGGFGEGDHGVTIVEFK